MCVFKIIILLINCAIMCLGSVHDEKIDYQLIANDETTKNKSVQVPDNFQNSETIGKDLVNQENSPTLYRKQHVNESFEKIQLMDNGVVTKSTFIPLLPEDLSLNYSAKNPEDDQTMNKSTYNMLFQNSFKSVEALKADPEVKINETVIVKNGKKYRIIKIKKNIKRNGEFRNNQNNQRQNRTMDPLKFLPNLLSLLPVKWISKEVKQEPTDQELRIENETLWSKVTTIPGQTNSGEASNPALQGTEKIKKLLNLFTIVKYDQKECYADGVRGICLHQADCTTIGGSYTTTCGKQLGVCCYAESTCGGTTKAIETYFVNEGFPEATTIAPRVCTLTLDKVDSDVRQLRLDFLAFQLRDPTNGTCLNDRLVVTGQDVNIVIPEICGVNTGHHIYIDVEDSNGPYNLNVITMGEYFPRNFRIKVTQLKKGNELLAPKNCLQYYVEPMGVLQTFNYQDVLKDNPDNIPSGYFNNLNYAICIKKLRGFCSITYENEETDISKPSFQLINTDTDGQKLLPPRQAGAETFDCPDDYIVVNGMRLCGERLNDAATEIDFTKNYPVTDNNNGPFMLSVRTDDTITGRGFSLKFRQNPCVI